MPRFEGYALIKGKGKKKLLTNAATNSEARENFAKMARVPRKEILKISVKRAGVFSSGRY